MNNQTFEEFYLKYRKISRGYAYGVLHDWSAADDVSQDVLYKMYTIKDGLNIDNEKMMFSLIKRASMNKALDYINTTLQLFHKKNIVQDFLMYNEFDPKHYKGK